MEHQTVKMIVKDANKQIRSMRYFKAKRDVAAFLCKMRPQTYAEFLFFKDLLKIASKKERLLEVQSNESFLELPYDKLLYVTLPQEGMEKKEKGRNDEKSA